MWDSFDGEIKDFVDINKGNRVIRICRMRIIRQIINLRKNDKNSYKFLNLFISKDFYLSEL